ncbi:hypothetical protein PIB30_050187 [Stylosanthes scabra]|uniref:Uncharacterized protein n=1 Tax=Stylosanthes scabra TaxID=79078 RepID=A0ABU6TH93_9FABA|nr:hypothetical protein [Stylosanthes scabra]
MMAKEAPVPSQPLSQLAPPPFFSHPAYDHHSVVFRLKSASHSSQSSWIVLAQQLVLVANQRGRLRRRLRCLNLEKQTTQSTPPPPSTTKEKEERRVTEENLNNGRKINSGRNNDLWQYSTATPLEGKTANQEGCCC